MELLESELDKLALSIKQLEKQREVLGKSISSVKKNLLFTSKDPDILEDKFIFKVEPSPLKECKIAGIDGGIVNSRYHGTSLMVGRAVSVLFDYKNGKLLDTNYYPDPFPDPRAIALIDPLTNRDFALNVLIDRQKMEVSTAVGTIEKFSPDLLLMDGSIIPYGMDKPSKDSRVYKEYSELVNAYTTFYETCKKNSTLLAGVVEDSAGLRLTSLLENKIIPGMIKSEEFERDLTLVLDQNKEILKKTNDSNIMYHILEVGERSCVFSYSKNAGKHNVLADLEKWGSQINSFYLKSVEFDRPIRVDFLAERENAGKIADNVASMILALSMHNETYGCPSILIEADARAKLSENDLERVYHRLKDKVGDAPSLFKLRRELRPF